VNVRELIVELSKYEMGDEVFVSGFPFQGSEDPIVVLQEIKRPNIMDKGVTLLIDFEPHNLNLKHMGLKEEDDGKQ